MNALGALRLNSLTEPLLRKAAPQSATIQLFFTSRFLNNMLSYTAISPLYPHPTVVLDIIYQFPIIEDGNLCLLHQPPHLNTALLPSFIFAN